MFQAIRKFFVAGGPARLVEIYADRVARIGVLVPLLHFAFLAPGIFSYVLKHLLSDRHETDGGDVTFTVTSEAFNGFFWLMNFWLYAIAAGFLCYASYRLLLKVYGREGPKALIVRTLFAWFVCSGNVEKMVATTVSVPVKYAPKFDGTLYFDLGGLVRSPAFFHGHYSLAADYSVFPLTAFCLLCVLYFSRKVVTEYKNLAGV